MFKNNHLTKLYSTYFAGILALVTSGLVIDNAFEKRKTKLATVFKAEMNANLAKKLEEKEYYSKEISRIESIIDQMQAEFSDVLSKQLKQENLVIEKELELKREHELYNQLSLKLGPLHPKMEKKQAKLDNLSIELDNLKNNKVRPGFYTKIYTEKTNLQKELLQELDYYQASYIAAGNEVLELDKKVIGLEETAL